MNLPTYLYSAALLAAGLWGCSGQADPGASGGGAGTTTTTASGLPACPPDTGVEPPHTDLVGDYSVPVPAALEPYAHYPIDSVTACTRGDLLEIGYKLPALLIGKEEHVSFVGPYDPAADTLSLSGDGTATCDVSAEGWSCLEHFVGIEVDLEAVAEEAADLSPAEAAARIDVAEYFGSDPIGILDFTP